jgi:acetyl-CoA synthetase
MEAAVLGGEVVWRPSHEVLEASRLARFMRRYGLASYEDLYRRSVEDPDWFWPAALEEMDVRWYRPYQRVYDDRRGVEWTEWFCGGQLNLVHNALDKYRGTPAASRVALRWEGEDGSQRALTYEELDAETCRAAAALRRLGVGRGDRVALYLPMVPEVAVALLACAKVGAIVTPVFSGFAPEAVATRVRDCEATLLITADGFYRRGQTVPLWRYADEAARQCPSVEHLLVVRRVGHTDGWRPGRDVWWHEATAGQPADTPTEPMGSMDPFMIIYTSGTTGRPKGTVHVHAGFPIKAAAATWPSTSTCRPGDVVFWLTDMGWMMGPWQVFGILDPGRHPGPVRRASLDHPHPGRLWALVDRHRVTVLGTRAHRGAGPHAVRRGARPKGGSRLPARPGLHR